MAPNYHPNESVFTWAAPPLKFGEGAVEEISYDIRSFGAESALIITDKGVRDAGTPDRVAEQIRSTGMECDVFDGVGVEPTDVSINEAVEYARQRDWGCYVAIGGGSALDTAKAVNLLTTHEGDLMEFITPPIGAGRKPDRPLKPLIAIPTTAGTGSESTNICVVDLLSMHLKAGVSSPALKPKLAIVDPVVTYTMPPQVTAASGMDVLSHALESYTAIPFDRMEAPEDPTKRPAFCGSNPVSDVWCEMALSLVGRYLPRAVINGRDREARYHLALASMYAGTGFGNAGTHLPHANAYPIAGAVKDYQAEGYPEMPMVPHGQAVSSTAAEVFRWTYVSNPQRHLKAASLLSGQTFTETDGADALASVLHNLMRNIDMPRGLRSFGYDESDLDTLVEGAFKQTRQLAVVPRPLTKDAARSIFERSL